MKAKGWIALGLGAALTVWICIDPSRFKADFYPPDRSFVGPNLVAAVVQGIIILIVVALVYPPLRRWIDNELHKVHQKIDQGHAEIHAKLDHVITNSKDIPEFKPKKVSIK